MQHAKIGGLYMTVKRRPWEDWWTRRAGPNFMKTRKQDMTLYEHIAKLVKGKSVLDVGCETCVIYPYFEDTEIKYAGIDITEKFVEQAKFIHPGIDVKCATALDIPYVDCSFDTVFAKAVIDHIKPGDHLTAISEMLRVAKNQVIISWFQRPWDRAPRIWDRGYITVRHDKRPIVALIESFPRFKSINYENYGRYIIYDIELEECK